ncbi:hypothetical protein AGDE_03948 [Angomonas deanei]|uniref:Sedlin, N-terminal conserved region containing protein, putative n=1 Tax=Angomonas deanei TaxID=59799 RepID=A0A7G2CWE2_9TRYP|nr:hypothetical protein AGDE_03948 [Angomonas deanei]CAD2222572.1 Sedlin, N-terminal conserved region containing protein, putative [Angomonas deanei]|eukprot:EPY39980.1 hypothetical protein AGDE_03948 [Angomonas deanei]
MKLSHFFIIGPNDSVIYEFSGDDGDSVQVLRQFFTYASLDVIDDVMWTKGDFYLNKVDHSSELFISAYIGLAPIKLVLMHDADQSDTVRQFFSEVYEVVVKYLLNPFSEPNKDIHSPFVHESIVALHKKYSS